MPSSLPESGSGQRSNEILTSKRDFDVHQITLALIQNVSEILDIDFGSDPQLARELGMHIQPAIGRIRAGIPIQNPPLEDIQNRYDEIYQACTAGCISLSASYGLPALFRQAKSDSYPYISPWHWTDGRSLPDASRLSSYARPVSEAPDCLPRICTRLTRIWISAAPHQRSISNRKKLAQNDIDLIISTVRLDTTYRYIYVSPLLNRQDRMLLDSKFQLILSQKSDRRPHAEKKVPKTSFTRKDIHFVSRTGAEIEYLLDHIRIGRAPVLQARQEILAYAASLFSDTPEMESHFYEILKKRRSRLPTHI